MVQNLLRGWNPAPQKCFSLYLAAYFCEQQLAGTLSAMAGLAAASQPGHAPQQSAQLLHESLQAPLQEQVQPSPVQPEATQQAHDAPLLVVP